MKLTQDSKLGTQNCLERGFTLIEMVVVIAILSMVALLVIPRLPSTDAGRLRSSARSLAAAIRYLEDRSVTTKTAYRLHLNLSEESVTVKKLAAGGEEEAADDPFLNRLALAEGVTIEDVRLPRLGRMSEGEVIVEFGPAGLGDFLAIHLKGEGGGGGQYTLLAYPNSGKVKVLEGYQEGES